MSRRSALCALADELHGRRSATRDWMDLISASNSALVTPVLREALAADDVPEDVAAFMDMIAARNDERNKRLRAMMLDATVMLNTAGVTPIYLKGMAIWAASRPNAASCPRMMSDVDLLVRPDEAERALEALRAGGFHIHARHDEHRHEVADLWRDGDVGVLDLHRRPPGPLGVAAQFDRDADTFAASWRGEARVPSPTHQVYTICMHDMFQDAGFLRGGFDVRHLCDIAELARHPDGVDWDLLMSLPPTRLIRNAMLAQLVAARRIAAAAIPERLLRAILPRLHHQRHKAQYLTSALELPLGLVGVGMEALNLRQHWLYMADTMSSPSNLFRQLVGRRPLPNRM